MIRIWLTAAVTATVISGCGGEGGDPGVAAGEAVTWAEHVAPIVYRHCASCHRPGGPAPFALHDRKSVAARGRQIVEVTRSGFMPPWLPDEGGLALRGGRRLPADDAAALARWVEQGMPSGKGTPPAPPEHVEWPMGKPDLILELTGSVAVPPEGDGILHTVVYPLGFRENQDLIAVQMVPSEPRVLHGVGWLFDTTGYALSADRAWPGPGYRDMGGVGMNIIGSLGGRVPGRDAIFLPEGYAFPLNGKGSLSVQLHFNTIGKPAVERSRIGLYFAKEPRRHTVTDVVMGSLCVDIPPGTSDHVVTDEITLPVATRLLGLYPKARYVCKRLEVTLTLPGAEPLPALTLSDYDFNWVEPYWLADPHALPAGTKVALKYVYDNSEANTRNPHAPPRRVRLGRNAEDEMAFLILYLAPENEVELQSLEKLHQDQFAKRLRLRQEWARGK